MIPYIEDVYSPEEATAYFDFIRVLPSVRPHNARNKTSFLRRLSFPGYSPPLTHRHDNHKAGYDVRGIVENAPAEYKMCAARITEYAASVSLPTPINYLSTIGYLSDDCMNFHQHHEDQKRGDQTVYVLSLGATHPVAIRSGVTMPGIGRKPPKFMPDGKDDYILYPTHGSLYVLPDSFNRPGSGDEHQHAVLEGTDYSFRGLRISINCKHVPPGLSPEEMKRACSRPAGRSQSQDSGLLMNSVKKKKTRTSSPSSPRVCWGSMADFPDAIYTGKRNNRGKFKYPETPFGNFKKLNTKTIPTFREYALDRMRNAEFRAKVEAVRGKDLLCPWCRPGEKDCHTLVWLELANQLDAEYPSERMCDVDGCGKIAVPDWIVGFGGDGTKCYEHGGNIWSWRRDKSPEELSTTN